MNVHDVRNLRDAQVGAITELTGELQYHESMHRFALVDPAQRNASVYVHFFRGGRSVFDESFGPGRPPRCYDHVARYIGQRVRVKGAISHSQIDVDVGDIVALADAPKVAD
jgi:hypothetical protein